MSRKKCNFLIFSIGACGYGMLEVIWRGYTHWSMLCAGGMSFLGLSSIARQMKKCGRLLKAAAGSALITGIEYVFGVIFNIILKKNVWDYSQMPLNLSGQICPLYSFFWLLLSLVAIPFAGRLTQRLENAAPIAKAAQAPARAAGNLSAKRIKTRL